MTRQEAHGIFNRLRAQFAAKRPALGKLRLVLRKRHFLRHPKPRDLAWYDERDGTVSLMEAALAGPSGRVEGLLAHELGHALDADTSRPYAERRADALAKRVLGVPVRYDDGDVQNLHRGVTPRPARLHENREPEMKRNPSVIATIRAGYRIKNNETGEIWTVMGVGPTIRGTQRYVVKDVHGDKHSLRREDLLQGQKDGILTVLDIANRNPKKGYKMPETQARHTAEGLLARMKADGADTFAKKVAWVKKHIPSIDRPRTFVGWVTKGERGRVVYKKRNPLAGPYPKKVDWDDADSFEAHIVLDDGQVVAAGKLKHSTVDSALAAVNGLLKFGGQISPYRVKMIEILAYRGNDYLGSQRWVQEGSKRNPTPAYHRSRGDAELMLAEDSYRKAQALRRRGDASGSHDALIHAHRMAALAEADLLDGASPRAADAKRLAWWKAYSGLAADKRRNPRRSR